jgi:type 1 glutamine amidotransferase
MPGAKGLLLAGAGRYADPWHRYPETSPLIRDILAGAGVQVEIDEDIDGRLADLRGVDLLIVNAGDPTSGNGGAPAPDAATTRAARDGLDAFVARGGALLGIHAAAASLVDYPVWTRTLGARWIPGVSRHPPFGLTEVTVTSVRVERRCGFPVDDIGDFSLYDERYIFLTVADDVTVVASHEYEGRRHPLLLTHVTGTSRAVYDALGHDVRAYASAAHRALLVRAAKWLLEPT